MTDLTLVEFLVRLKEWTVLIVVKPLWTILRGLLLTLIAQLTGEKSLRWVSLINRVALQTLCMNKDRNEEPLARSLKR